MKKLILLLLLCMFGISITKAQYVYGTTGLLHMPTADMQQDKTFLFGGSFLNEKSTPGHWDYNTFNYYINITFFPWLEVGYLLTLHKAPYGSTYYPEFVWGKYCNQDRSFHGRLRVWKEGWWKEWMPQIVIGANDAGTNDRTTEKDFGIGMTGTSTINGHWQRYYIAVSKHFEFHGMGNLGAHVAYVYNERPDYHLNGPCVGANFLFQLPEGNKWHKVLNGLNLMGEYDSRTINVGASYSIWKDHVNIIAEMTECKYFSGGIFFKVHL